MQLETHTLLQLEMYLPNDLVKRAEAEPEDSAGSATGLLGDETDSEKLWMIGGESHPYPKSYQPDMQSISPVLPSRSASSSSSGDTGFGGKSQTQRAGRKAEKCAATQVARP